MQRAANAQQALNKKPPDGGLLSEACPPSLLPSFGKTTFAPQAKVGGARGSRTPDLVNAIHALSQLSYGPSRGQVSAIRRKRHLKSRFSFLMPDA